MFCVRGVKAFPAATAGKGNVPLVPRMDGHVKVFELTCKKVVALVLAVLGIYAVVAYTVRDRRRELGVRMALGAREGQVIGLVVAQGVRLAGIGLAIGFAGALLGSQLLSALLFGISPDDLTTYEIVFVALMAVSVLASWVPARRAATIDPVIAMRPE